MGAVKKTGQRRCPCDARAFRGGTHAAAFSYGVLKAMRDIEISIDGRLTALADEVSTYFDKDTRKCVHFVDGGITEEQVIVH